MYNHKIFLTINQDVISSGCLAILLPALKSGNGFRNFQYIFAYLPSNKTKTGKHGTSVSIN